MEKNINIREYAISICDIFEELLEEKDITIPDEFREGNEGEARIFGDTYYQLELNVLGVLLDLVATINDKNSTKKPIVYDTDI